LSAVDCCEWRPGLRRSCLRREHGRKDDRAHGRAEARIYDRQQGREP
jgi:hypothetical protein